MATVHTNKEDRAKDMADEIKVNSIFDASPEVEELEPEYKARHNYPTFDEWLKMSQAERDLMRDINTPDLSYLEI